MAWSSKEQKTKSGYSVKPHRKLHDTILILFVYYMFCGIVHCAQLQELFGDGFECFESLSSFEKAAFVLGSELCALLRIT